MRILTVLSVAGLLASAVLAPRRFTARPPAPAEVRFVEPDLAARAEIGKREHALGVQLSAYEEQVKRDPENVEALRGRFVAGMLLGAVALGQPNLHELVAQQTDLYLLRRAEMDPDGSLLQDTLRTWCALRLEHPYLYASCSVAIYLAARGDPKGFEAYRTYMEKGPFYAQFFPYVRRFHPSWRAVEPLVAHYMAQPDPAARVEAGATLIEYYVHYGLRPPDFDTLLEQARDAFERMRRRIYRRGRMEGDLWDRGMTAIFGIAALANLGFEKERETLRRMNGPRDYPRHVEVIQIAKIWGGLLPFERFLPTGNAFKLLNPLLHEFYFRAAAHRAAVIARTLAEPDLAPERRRGLEKDLEFVRRLLDAGFHGGHMWTRVACMRALAALEGPAAELMLQEVIAGRGVPSLFAASLVDKLEDPVGVLLPGLRSPEPDYAALAAVSLLDLGDLRPIQRAPRAVR